MIPIAAWSVDVTLPDGVRCELITADRARIVYTSSAVIELARVAGPAPATIEALVAGMGLEMVPESLGEGETEHGGRYAIRRFEHRDDFRAGGMQVQHRVVLYRVDVTVPLDEQRHVRCRGEVFGGAAPEFDEGRIGELAEMCRSVRLVGR